VRRRKARENVRGFHRLGQLLVGHRFHLAAEQDFSALMPTSVQTLRVTRSLSPVSTLTVTPCCRSAVMALAAVSLGGSRNAR
jgi:hypothetical protein